MRTLIGMLAVTVLVGCGDDGGKGGGDGGPEDGGGTGDGLPVDAMIDAPIDAMIDAPPGTTALTVKNYLAWCSVSVNGGTASTGSQQVANVAPGVITLTARRANSTFTVLGNMWHHTDGDTGNGETGMITNPTDEVTRTSTAMVTVGATAKCVWVCCPFKADGGGCDFPGDVVEQCP